MKTGGISVPKSYQLTDGTEVHQEVTEECDLELILNKYINVVAS